MASLPRLPFTRHGGSRVNARWHRTTPRARRCRSPDNDYHVSGCNTIIAVHFAGLRPLIGRWSRHRRPHWTGLAGMSDVPAHDTPR